MGRIHSLQSLGTVDGPGIRFVVFFQGCPLRCGFCHNPDTHNPRGGKEMSAREILEKVKRCRDYFGPEGGITLSGGEPLWQADFARELLALCKEEDIHTCLDTSGCLFNNKVEAVLSLCDRVLLDIKFTDDALYRAHIGCSYEGVLAFLDTLNARHIPTTLRQVILPGLNTDEASLSRLRELKLSHSCVDGVELLPFRKICQVKYDTLGIPFPFAHIPTPTAEEMSRAKETVLT